MDTSQYGGQVLVDHDASRLPIAKMSGIDKSGRRSTGVVDFPAEGTSADSDLVWRLIQSRMLNFTSVGFLVVQRGERRDDGAILIPRWRLLEVSFVAIPALSSATILERHASGNSAALAAAVWREDRRHAMAQIYRASNPNDQLLANIRHERQDESDRQRRAREAEALRLAGLRQ